MALKPAEKATSVTAVVDGAARVRCGQRSLGNISFWAVELVFAAVQLPSGHGRKSCSAMGWQLQFKSRIAANMPRIDQNLNRTRCCLKLRRTLHS